MGTDLFAGIRVSDYQRALSWYEALLGSAPSFLPNDTEAVWDVNEHGYLYVDVQPERAGHAMQTIFVEDVDSWIQGIHSRGIEPDETETYSNGVRKAIYRDPDGNEIGIGGKHSAG
jgi:catechol 2,3-dioxygenase-like lactoylglutathione lyase family enzyme